MASASISGQSMGRLPTRSLQSRIDFLLSSGVGSRACPSCFILLLSFTFYGGGGCGSHHSHPGKKSTALSYINLSVYHQNYEYYSKSLQTPQITTCRITRVQSVPYLQSQQRRRTPHPGVERARSTYQTQQHQSHNQHIIPCACAMMGGVARTLPPPV